LTLVRSGVTLSPRTPKELVKESAVVHSLVAIRSFLVVAVTAASLAGLGIDLFRTACTAAHTAQTVVLVAKL